jgi:imidazoleglycerol-phosphate dehydratase
MRRARVERNTKETQIVVEVNLDGTGATDIATPMPFFGHMLDAFGRHSLIDLKIDARGDVPVDGHHTVEDTGICLGQAVREALGDRRGIVRYGDSTLPMDEALVRVAVDFGGRAAFVYGADALRGRRVGSFDAELAREFFGGFALHGALQPAHAGPLRRKRPPHLGGLVQGICSRFADGLGRRPARSQRAFHQGNVDGLTWLLHHFANG